MGLSRLHSPFDVVKVNGKTVLKKMMRGNKTIGFSSTTTRTSLLIIFLMYGLRLMVKFNLSQARNLTSK